MNTLETDLAKVQAKSTQLESTESTVLTSIIGRLEDISQRLTSGTITLQAALPGLTTAVTNGSARLNEAIKDVQAPLNKLGKNIDKVRLNSRISSMVCLCSELVDRNSLLI